MDVGRQNLCACRFPEAPLDEGGSNLETGPLSDITVIEVAEGVAGPFCGRLLAGFGAKVIKVERPPHGDWTRWAEPQLTGLAPPESGALYLFNNMGKQSVTIDWTKPEGMTALRGLVEGADDVGVVGLFGADLNGNTNVGHTVSWH